MTDDDRNLHRYSEVFQRWGKPEQLEWVLKWITPEELQELCQAIGTPQDATRLVKALKERSADWDWAKTSRQKLSLAAKIFVAMGALLVAWRTAQDAISVWLGMPK